MALTGAPLLVSTTSWDFNAYQRIIEPSTYEKMKLVPVVDESQRLFNQLTVRKHARVQASTLAESSDGTGLTYLDPRGTAVTLTPVHTICPVAYGPHIDAQSDFSIDSEAASELEQSMAEQTERNVMANFTSATQFLSDANVTTGNLRQGLARLVGNTNGMFGPGTDTQIYGFFSHTQLPILQGFPEVNSAEMRGDTENPYVRGIWVKGFGFVLNISTVVPQDANGWHNALLVPSAMVTSWNKRTYIERTQYEAAKIVLAQNNMGSNIKHDARMFVIRTTTDNA